MPHELGGHGMSWDGNASKAGPTSLSSYQEPLRVGNRLPLKYKVSFLASDASTGKQLGVLRSASDFVQVSVLMSQIG